MAERTLARALGVIGVALLVMGLIVGLFPANSGAVACGSPFFPSDSLDEVVFPRNSLDEAIKRECNLGGGLAARRAVAVGLLAGGLVVIVGAAILPDDRRHRMRAALQDARSASRTSHESSEQTGRVSDEP